MLDSQYWRYLNLDNYREHLAEQRRTLIDTEYWQPHRERMSQLKDLSERYAEDLSALSFDPSDTVSIAKKDQLPEELFALLSEIVMDLIPWRKGPFNLFGIEIDTEWRSDKKWNRIRPALKHPRGARIADVGCSNGYYMFRLLKEDPRLVYGMDPSARCYYQFQLIQHFLRDDRLCFDPLGVEHLTSFNELFDLVLCMGVIYHRRDPYQMLDQLKQSMRKGGQLILETLALTGDSPYCLCPPDRYAKMRNVWFIPSEGTLFTWLKKSGFDNIEKVSEEYVTLDEQRKTPFAPYESLEDFLDPANGLTIEGFPPPLRVAFSAFKR